MMNVLLLGGCGYIGSALYQYLVPFFKVTTVDLEWFGNYVNEDNLPLDYSALSLEFIDRFDSVVLLAGHSSVPMCRSRSGTFKNNVQNFVELLGKLKHQKFIYASSSSVYGNTKNVFATEEFTEPLIGNYYDLSKREIDYYAKLSDLQYYGLRLGTVNGFSLNLRTDIMVNKMYDCAATTGRVAITNKHIFRPILGISDLCKAIKVILDCPDDRRGIYNLASFNTQLFVLADVVARILRVPLVENQSTAAYDFSINTDKFCFAFDFKFEDTVESIVRSLDVSYSLANKSERIEHEYR